MLQLRHLALLALCFSSTWIYAAEPQKLVFLGDSLSAGYGVNPDESFPSLVTREIEKEKLPVQVVNAGSSGDTSSGGLRRLPWILKQKPAFVVIELGANDMLRGISPLETEKNLGQMIEAAKAAGSRPILFGMKATPNMGPSFKKNFDAIYPALARKYKVPFLPFFIEEVAAKPQLNQGDGIHPNKEGHKIVAQKVWKFLKPIVKAK